MVCMWLLMTESLDAEPPIIAGPLVPELDSEAEFQQLLSLEAQICRSTVGVAEKVDRFLQLGINQPAACQFELNWQNVAQQRRL